MYSIGTGNREFWMHLWRMLSKKEFEGKGGWLMRQKEELIWDRRGAERKHGTRSTARLLIFPFNHPASLARVRSALPSASLVPTDSSAGETSHTPRPTLAQVARGSVPNPSIVMWTCACVYIILCKKMLTTQQTGGAGGRTVAMDGTELRRVHDERTAASWP